MNLLLRLTCVCVCVAGIFASPLLKAVKEEFEVADNDTTIEPAETTLTPATIATQTTMPPTVQPLSTAPTGTGATIEPITTITPAVISTMSTTQGPPPPPEKETGFDGGSFGGGIGTGIGICLILFVAWKLYIMKSRGAGYSTM